MLEFHRFFRGPHTPVNNRLSNLPEKYFGKFPIGFFALEKSIQLLWRKLPEILFIQAQIVPGDRPEMNPERLFV